MLRRICMVVQIQPSKYVLDHAGWTAPNRQHEPDHTDQESICPAWQIQIINWESDLSDLSDLCNYCCCTHTLRTN